MRRMALVALLLVALSVSALAAADSGGKTVATRGDETLVPNQRIFSDLRFSPGAVTIQSGDTVTWVHDDKTDDPHTITLATTDQLVQDVEDAFGGACPACEAAAGAALAAHFPLPPPAPPVFDVNVGSPAFAEPGDSLLIFPQGSGPLPSTATKTISSPPGTTLHYFCAIHPWMQGSIEVGG